MGSPELDAAATDSPGRQSTDVRELPSSAAPETDEINRAQPEVPVLVLGETAEKASPVTNDEPSPTLDALIAELEVAPDSEPVQVPEAVDEPAQSSPTLDEPTSTPEVAPQPEPVEEPLSVEEPATSPDPAEVSIPNEDTASTASIGASISVPDLGGSAWAVVIAGAADPFDPLLEDTVANLTAEGYETLITNCDVGAAEAIGMQAALSYTVSVYAQDRENAEGLADILRENDLSGTVAQVSVDCG